MHTSTKGHFWVGPTVGRWGAVCLCLLVVGCERSELFRRHRGQSAASAETESAARASTKQTPLPGTIGSVCRIEGTRSIFVEGYGLVGGLGERGSAECPGPLRKDLADMITKAQKRMKNVRQSELAPAGSLIASRDTAVVRVSGRIPAGALRGEGFDVRVEALPSTSTTSLANGWLYACDLRVSAGAAYHAAKSRIFARAIGPVFVNPFGQARTERRGTILGGGVNVDSRPVSLLLHQPSYAMAQAVEQRINSVFPPPEHDSTRRCAKAVSSGKIELHIPRTYRLRKTYFLALLTSVHIQSTPAVLERRAREMTAEIVDPLANAEAISFAWEAMGRNILPLIAPLYRSSNRQAAFYAARAGAALGDNLAIERLARFALTSGDDDQRKAVEQLSYSRLYTARKILQQVLDLNDVELRVIAYQGLSQARDVSIGSQLLGDDGFVLAVAAATRWPLVYVRRTTEPTIAVFGGIEIEPPVFYAHPDESIIITADNGDETITLVRKWPSGQISGRIAAPKDLPAFIRLLGGNVEEHAGKLVGLGLSYGHVVSILHAMCADGSIPARFKTEDRGAAAPLPDYSLGRPEKEE